jgi:hypothetical protein
MSSLKKSLCRYLAVWFLALLAAGVFAQPAEGAVKLNTTGLSLCVGDTYKLQVTGTKKKVTYKSSKPKVAKVTSKGTVRALKAGSATVTATVSKKSYSCKVTVNKTFKVDKTSVSIKKNTEVTAYLSVSGSVNVNASVADKKICSAAFGKWDGDYMPLTIIPKQVGSTTITLTNSVNKESCVIKVKVTAVPVNATFQEPTVSTGAKLFIAGENSMNFKFSLDRKAANVLFRIYDESGDVLRTIQVGTLKASKTKSVAWDGKDESGNPVDGTFTYGVIADGTKTVGGTGRVYAASPFGKGDGTQSNPYLVSDQSEFALIKSYNGCYFAQDADIDFGYDPFSSLFTDADAFTGSFDGKYNGKSYRMQNLYGAASLFGSVSGSGIIQNVSLSNCVNTGSSFLVTTNSGTIENCSIVGDIQCSSGMQSAMVALYNKGQIRGCNVSGTINLSAGNVIGSTTLKAGSIAVSNTGRIVQCTSSVTFNQKMQVGTYIQTSTYEIYTGGIVAENASGAFITLSTYTGSITADIQLPDAVKDVEGIYSGTKYSGYVAGRNNGYINTCSSAGAAAGLSAQGTGSGVVQ